MSTGTIMPANAVSAAAEVITRDHRYSGLIVTGGRRLADILSDRETLVAARREAFDLVRADPGLREHRAVAEEVRALLGDEVDWLFIS